MNAVSPALHVVPGTPGHPICRLCGRQTRLFGLEPHPNFDATDLRTFVCEGCQAFQVEVVPLDLRA